MRIFAQWKAFLWAMALYRGYRAGRNRYALRFASQIKNSLRVETVACQSSKTTKN